MDQTLLRPDVSAGKYDASKFDPQGLCLYVNEIFYSIQGEGYHTGKPAIFVRLSQCNLACKFCDTEFEKGALLPIHNIFDRIRQAMDEVQPPSYYQANPHHIEGLTKGMNSLLAQYPALVPGAGVINRKPMVILTGGEPALQNCGPLVRLLHNDQWYVALETSGSVWFDWMAEVDWLCCSPKVSMERMHPKLLNNVDELKWIVNEAFLRIMAHDIRKVFFERRNGIPINSLQPESCVEMYTQYAIALVKLFPQMYTLSLQTHKLTNQP